MARRAGPRGVLRYGVLLRRLRRAGVTGRLLDAGCGAGAFVYHARRRGFDAYGFDPALGGVPAERRPFLAAASEEAMLAAQAPFDAAVSNYVLEHVTDVVAWLADVSALLRPGAALIIRVPDARYTRRYPRTGRLQRRPGEHRFFFTPASLTAVLRRAGFTGIQVGAPLSTASLITPAVSLLPWLDPEGARGAAGPVKLAGLAVASACLAPVVFWRRVRGPDAVLEAWAVKPTHS